MVVNGRPVGAAAGNMIAIHTLQPLQRLVLLGREGVTLTENTCSDRLLFSGCRYFGFTSDVLCWGLPIPY